MTFRTFIGALRARAARPRAEDGFMLIEVLISALLVALIITATLTGFDSVGRATGDQRFHDQATLVASESQEAMRSDPASALSYISGLENGRAYTTKVGGEIYTVTQVVKYVTNSTEATTCKTAAGATTSGVFAHIESQVTWPQLASEKRKALTESSIITPPDGSGLEVDATNAAQPTQPVEGVNVTVKEEKGSTSTTTSAEGCAIFGAIPATAVSLEAYKPDFVTPAGEYKVVKEELLITPNLTTHYPITLEEGGAIEAEFVYKGAREFKGIPVTGDTFVVYNQEMGASPEFEVGSTRIKTYESGSYEALPAIASTGWATTATTPINTADYPTGNLFPFPSSPWTVYSGDCKSNKPPENVLEEEETLNEGEGGGKAIAGSTIKVKVPMTYVNLTVYSGTESASPGKVETTGEVKNKEEPYAVKLTNVTGTAKCKETPNNSLKEQSTIHLQKVMTTKESATRAGHLLAPFQPFGKFELCTWSKELKKTYTISYETSTTESTQTIYLGAKPGSAGVTILEGQSTNTC